MDEDAIDVRTIPPPAARRGIDLRILAHQASEAYLLFSVIAVAFLLGYIVGLPRDDERSLHLHLMGKQLAQPDDASYDDAPAVLAAEEAPE